MRTPLRAAAVAWLATLALATSSVAEEELFAGDYVDRGSQPSVTHEILSDRWLEYGDDHLMLVRTTFAPGAVIPDSIFSRHWSLTIESGELTVVPAKGRVVDGRREGQLIWRGSVKGCPRRPGGGCLGTHGPRVRLGMGRLLEGRNGHR